jgi:hypothetical protein
MPAFTTQKTRRAELATPAVQSPLAVEKFKLFLNADLAAVVGLGTVIERSAEVFTGLKPAGGAYVVWLGIQAILHRCPLAETAVVKLGALRPLRALTPP